MGVKFDVAAQQMTHVSRVNPSRTIDLSIGIGGEMVPVGSFVPDEASQEETEVDVLVSLSGSGGAAQITVSLGHTLRLSAALAINRSDIGLRLLGADGLVLPVINN